MRKFEMHRDHFQLKFLCGVMRNKFSRYGAVIKHTDTQTHRHTHTHRFVPRTVVTHSDRNLSWVNGTFREHRDDAGVPARAGQQKREETEKEKERERAETIVNHFCESHV